MPNFLSRLTKDEQARLLEELSYMNLGEIRGFCFPRGIPYRIVVDYANGKTKTTKDTDRKPIVLARIRHYLTTGEIGPASRIAPTFDEFARSWIKAKTGQHRLLTPEYAYLTDVKRRRADDDWKALRTAKAKSALKTLARIARSPRAAQRRLFR
jgi:hypothetical protein